MEAPFDILAYARKLEQAGMDRNLAELQAEALRHFEESQIQKIARELPAKADLRHGLDETKFEILKWVVNLSHAQTAIILAAIGIAVAWLSK